MHRRRLLTITGAALAISAAGCLGDDESAEPDDEPPRPDEGEFAAIQAFASDAIFGLEFSQLVFAALVNDEATRADVETAREDLETALEQREAVPEQSAVESWEFTAQSEGEEWDIDGAELWSVIDDMTTVTESTLSVVEEVLGVLDNGAVGESLADDMGQAMDDIDSVVPRAREIIFNN